MTTPDSPPPPSTPVSKGVLLAAAIVGVIALGLFGWLYTR